MDLLLRSKADVRGTRLMGLPYEALVTSEIARDINRDIVLEMIRSTQPVTRADLARCSGLHRATISDIVEQLIRESWILEGQPTPLPRGRPSIPLSLNKKLVMIAADVRPGQATIALIDLNGHLLARDTVSLVPDPRLSLIAITRSMQSMRASHSELSYKGIGISVPGRVDPRSQHSIRESDRKWGGFDIREFVEQKMSLQVELTDAANACLVSEVWSGRMNGVCNAVLLTVSDEINSAILVNGEIITSRSSFAGEFGHISIDPSGDKCECGQRGCWQSFASSKAALQYYAELCPAGRRPNIEHLHRMATEGDTAAMEAIARQAHYLGRGLRFITASLAPETIMIGGDLTRSWASTGPIVQAELDRAMLAGGAPYLSVVQADEMARLRGAASVVLLRHSGYNNSPNVHLNQ
jgi:predicted NBD/HSP70 family sugar kinase